MQKTDRCREILLPDQDINANPPELLWAIFNFLPVNLGRQICHFIFMAIKYKFYPQMID